MQMFYIALFGGLGAIARYGCGLLFEMHTLIVNISGSFLLALISVWLYESKKIPQQIAYALGTGFVGAYTTFSAFSLEVVVYLKAGNISAAILYIAATLLLGFAAAVAGICLGKGICAQKEAV